jgi:hypothetical protein
MHEWVDHKMVCSLINLGLTAEKIPSFSGEISEGLRKAK